MIKLKRRTGWVGMAVSLKIRVNGEVVDKIEHQQELSLNLEQSPSSLQVTQAGSKSNTIDVTNGDTLVIRSTFIDILFFSILLISFITSTVFHQYDLLWLVLTPWLIYIIVLLFVPGSLHRIEIGGSAYDN
ncbi:hypothetical protein [Ruoffia tabacinasalis]|uniref:Uncharacterized protein n=1 Tax=Ruoffia tabacinasalis TaxID=87458 RepID=A0ABS0LKG4_9LACT|nr:hypothetical protein [Ruoffia tabacinasalis]MBG9978743.1 hypothetical protein [Ruoffia tabacinasalis]